MKRFLTSISFLVFCFALSAQSSAKKNFDFAAPDASFVKNEAGDGYRSQELKSSIQLNVFPISYETIIKDVDNNVKDNMKVVSSEPKSIGAHKGYLQKVHLGGADGFVGLSFFLPTEDGTIVMHGSYPQGEEAALYEKYLKAFESLATK